MSRFYVALKVSFLSGFVITLHCLISLSQRPYFSKINFIPNLQSEININNLLPMQCVLYAVNIKCRVLCTRVNIVNHISAYHHIQPWQVHTCTNIGHRSSVALPSCRYSWHLAIFLQCPCRVNVVVASFLRLCNHHLHVNMGQVTL